MIRIKTRSTTVNSQKDSTQLPEEVILDQEHGLIRIKSIGDVPTSEWRKSMEKVLELKEKHRINRLLIDSKEQLSTSGYSEIFEFAKWFPKDIKLALLVEDATGGRVLSTEPKQRFLEAIGLQENIDVKSFVDEEEAMSWLGNQ